MRRFSPDWPRLSAQAVYRPKAEGKLELLTFDGPGLTQFHILAEPADDHVKVVTLLWNVLRDKAIERRASRLDIEQAPVGSRGGHRVYFRCPKCERRCADIFFDIGDPEPVCRKCGGITYTSQNKTAYERKEERIAALRWRLGSRRNFHPIPPRPRGMHRKTYDRLVAEIKELESEFLSILDDRRRLRAHLFKPFTQMRDEADAEPDRARAELELEFINTWERHVRQDEGEDFDPGRGYLIP